MNAKTMAPFRIERLLDAPRERVWSAWTEVEHLVHWWGPKGFSVSHCTVDLRPGGMMHYCLRMPEGGEMWGRFVYREIVQPERLVWVNSFSDKDGGITRHPMAPDWPREMLAAIPANCPSSTKRSNRRVTRASRSEEKPTLSGF